MKVIKGGKDKSKPKIKKKKLRYDWEAIKVDWDANKISIRAIGRKHGISDTAIRKKAKDKKWRKRGSHKTKVRTKKAKVRSANQNTKPVPAKKRKPGRPKKVHPGGRPTKYKIEYNQQAFIACKTGGLDNLELCDLFAIKERTFYDWLHDYPKFSQSIKDGKLAYDNKNIVTALKHRAIGYSHKEDKIFNNSGVPLIVPTTKHYPPETNAIRTWLYNRDPDNWKDKKEVEHSGNISIGKMTDSELDKEMGDLEFIQKTERTQALITEGKDEAQRC